MSLLWAVPVVAAAIATVIVVARARALEDAAVAVATEVARLRELHRPLAAVREATAETDDVVQAFRRRHAVDEG